MNGDGITPVAAGAPAPTGTNKLVRLKDLALVLFVAVLPLILGSTYYLTGWTPTSEPRGQALRLGQAVVTEVGALLVLWHVLARQGRNWRDIGLTFRINDIGTGIGLFLGCYVVTYYAFLPVQYFYRFWFGHFWIPRPLNLGLGFSAMTLTFLCVNPFFEELIVRAYTMTEMIGFAGKGWLAVLVSVSAQMSYHFYQGWLRSLQLTIVFLLFSWYYVRTRKIMPVIIAHLCSDLSVLLRHSG